MTEVTLSKPEAPGNNKIGVDTGGTFTDFVWIGSDGHLHILKELSTPYDPAKAILAGMAVLDAPDTAGIVHGSTVATNALLERRGARTALITTRGFADVLAIGRQNRPELYALVPQKPEPLVPDQWRFEVDERVSTQGEILEALDPTTLPAIAELIAKFQIESVAVCLLFSFLRPEHERFIREWLQKWSSSATGKRSGTISPGLHVSLSSDILPEFREFERTSTTVINAYVAPLMSQYLNRLSNELAPRMLTVMQSNGGIASAAMAGEQAARTVLSGPAGGAVGASYLADLAGYHDIISFDMGGTSTDVALCPGQLPTTSEGEIAGLPLRLPIIDIHTVGAGGGSIAHVDPGGALQVGPQSAGADPGPACYSPLSSDQRKHGQEQRLKPTTTDANLILGRLDAEHFLGGYMHLNEEAAREVMLALAAEMGADSVEAAAAGVIDVANVNMERAIRRISVERGYDPRDFTLVAFGGAGPLHACELAASVQIPRVLVPAVPGVLSALGMLVAEPVKDYSLTIMHEITGPKEDTLRILSNQFELLAERAVAEMVQDGYSASDCALFQRLDMRYAGQSHELTVDLTPAPDQLQIRELLDAAHERRYGYRRPEAAVEIVNIRLRAAVHVERPRFRKRPLASADAGRAIVGKKAVYFGVSPAEAMLYDREGLLPGNQFYGPAVVFQYDTTTVVPPEWIVTVDSRANIILTKMA